MPGETGFIRTVMELSFIFILSIHVTQGKGKCKGVRGKNVK